MSAAAFLRVEKLKGGGIIAVAARHNKREIQEEMGAAGSIDPARSHLNFSLTRAATAGDVAQRAKDLMTAAGVKALRTDAVRAIEAVFSLPVGSQIDPRAYFIDCMDWAAAYFGGTANILSFDVHLDEAAPHAHALILPLVDGQMNGSDMVGARSKLLDMQSQFHDQVAKRYGLRKAPPKLKGEAKHRAAAQVLACLRETGDTALQSLAWPNIRACIESDPAPFLLALGLVTNEPAKPIKPFVDYVTSKGKGPRREQEQRPKAYIGFEHGGEVLEPYVGFANQSLGKSKPYLCGGFTQPIPQEAPAPTRQLSDIPDEFGEVAPPATRQQPPTMPMVSTTPPSAPPHPAKRPSTGQRLQTPVTDDSYTHAASMAGSQHPAPASDDEQTTVIRDDTEAGQWCEQLGQFINTSPNASKAPPRAARQTAMASPPGRGAMHARGMDTLDVFAEYDQPEVIEAWAD